METRAWLLTKLLPIVLVLIALGTAAYATYSFVASRELTLAELEEKYVPGVHGVKVIVAGEEVGSFMPWVPLELNTNLATSLKDVCLRAGKDAGCAQDTAARFSIFTREHVVTREGKAYTLVRTATPVRLSDINEEFIDARLGLIAAWARANQEPDGSFPYLYYPGADRYEEGDYLIRQLITVQGLYAIAKRNDDAELYSIAEKAEKHLMEESYRYDPAKRYAYFTEDDGVRLGAAALGILMIREKGDVLRAPTEEEVALGEFLLAMQRDDGSFQTFLQDEPTDVDEMFYSGEALTALARLSAVSQDARYDNALEKGFTHYRTKIADDFWPQYSPWHMQAYAIYFEETDNEEYARYVYWLAEGLIQTMLEDDPHARPDEEGRFFNPKYRDWGPPHSSSTGIYLEGLAYAYRLAKERDDAAEARRFEEAVRKGTRALMQVQWTPESAYYIQEPSRVVGHFKVSVTNNVGRIDQLGHAANAFVVVQDVLWK